MQTLLLGFQPFDQDTQNPSQRLLEQFDASLYPHPITTQVLPVVQADVARLLPALLDKHQPDLVLGLGLATGAPMIRLERVGLNWMDFGIPDEAGQQLLEQRLQEDAPDAYHSQLPLRTVQQTLWAEGIPVEISYTAGTYLCNQLLFTCLADLEARGRPRAASFIHLPLLPEMAARRQQTRRQILPSMSLAEMKRALHIILSSIFENTPP